jgi:hypothetical protein
LQPVQEQDKPGGNHGDGQQAHRHKKQRGTAMTAGVGFEQRVALQVC